MTILNDYDLEQILTIAGAPILTNCYKNYYKNEDGSTSELRIHGLLTLNCKLKYLTSGNEQTSIDNLNILEGLVKSGKLKIGTKTYNVNNVKWITQRDNLNDFQLIFKYDGIITDVATGVEVITDIAL